MIPVCWACAEGSTRKLPAIIAAIAKALIVWARVAFTRMLLMSDSFCLGCFTGLLWSQF
jgi:hypothetical protein